MHDATKRFNELEGDLKNSQIGEYTNRVSGCRPDSSKLRQTQVSDRLRA
jgi:hypothetical protein